MYSGGSTTNTIKQLNKKLDLEKNKYNIALAEQVTKGIKAYFDVVFSYKTVVINESYMKNLNRILEIVTIKYDNGAASIGDITAIKANVSNAQTQLIKVKSKLTESLRYYEYIVGEKYVDTLPYEKNFNINVSTFELLYERGIKRNKELVNYYESIEAEKYNLKSSEAGFAPKLDFELSVDNVMDKEDYLEREESLNGIFKFSYNLYNGGRDKNKVLSAFSNIRELNFKVEEEKKKLKWNISKLFTSIKSTNESLKSNISEVISLRSMVEAYWEEFKLGEQDLQVLLQGQKQLNSAETELIKYENNNITDFFTLLRYTGDLLAFFDIDPEHPKFIDFSKSNYIQEIYIDDKFLNAQEKQERADELKKEEEANAVLVKKAQKDENINNFLNKFLSSDDKFYTIDIGTFKNLLEANNFIKNNQFDKDSFSYDVVDDLNINSKVNYGIFENIDEAKKQVETFNKNKIGKNLEIKQLKDVKKLYNEYLAGLKVTIAPVEPEVQIVEKTNTIEKIKQEKKVELFKFNDEFKNDFLKTDGENFTINITSVNKKEDIEKILIAKPELYNKSFVFNYSDSVPLVRWDYGIYKTYNEASNAIDSLGDIKELYYPFVQKVSKEQDLYNNNINLNLEPETKKIEYEYINVSSKTVYKDPVLLKNTDPLKIKANEEAKKSIEENKVEKTVPAIQQELSENTINTEVLPEVQASVNTLTQESKVAEEIAVNQIVEPVKEIASENIAVQEESLPVVAEVKEQIQVKTESKDEVIQKSVSTTIYTIRLATNYDDPSVIDYSEKYNLKHSSQTVANPYDSDITMVIYGSFGSEEEAQKAIDELPGILAKANRPYVEVIEENNGLYNLYKDKIQNSKDR